MAKAPPTIGMAGIFCKVLPSYRSLSEQRERSGDVCPPTRTEMDALFLFLTEEGVEPTNNFGERTIRFAVLWRKRSQGTKARRETAGSSAFFRSDKPAAFTESQLSMSS